MAYLCPPRPKLTCLSAYFYNKHLLRCIHGPEKFHSTWYPSLCGDVTHTLTDKQPLICVRQTGPISYTLTLTTVTGKWTGLCQWQIVIQLLGSFLYLVHQMHIKVIWIYFKVCWVVCPLLLLLLTLQLWAESKSKKYVWVGHLKWHITATKAPLGT